MKLIDNLCIHNDKGYFLLEALVLGAILIALAAGLLSYAKAETVRARDACRLQGLFLAQAQLAMVEERAAHGVLTPGSLPWLGETDDLSPNGTEFTVTTTITAAGREYDVEVTANWHKGGKEGSVSLHRVVCHHV